MDVKTLKECFLKANLLPKYGLVTFTQGNVSEYDRDTGAMPHRLLDKHFFRKHGANAYY